MNELADGPEVHALLATLRARVGELEEYDRDAEMWHDAYITERNRAEAADEGLTALIRAVEEAMADGRMNLDLTSELSQAISVARASRKEGAETE